MLNGSPHQYPFTHSINASVSLLSSVTSRKLRLDTFFAVGSND